MFSPGALSKTNAHRAVALALIVSVGCSGSPAPSGEPARRTDAAAPGQPAAASPTSAGIYVLHPLSEPQTQLIQALGLPSAQVPASDAAARLEDIVSVLDQAVGRISRDTFDPDAVVRAVGQDPKSLLAWVRDNTRVIPYRGVLRGPMGVLMDRSGNSLDRSLLLADLVNRAGHSVRLVNATLTDAQAREVAAVVSTASRRVPEGDSTSASTWMLEQVDAHIGRHKGDVAQARQILNTIRKNGLAAEEQVRRRTAAQTAVLKESLGGVLQRTPAGPSSTQLSDLKDHWWVQVRIGDAWVDFDSTRPASQPSQTIARAIRTFDPRQLPDEVYHRVRIKALVERIENGQLTEQPVLEHIVRVANLAAARVRFGHSPNGPDSDPNPQDQAAWLKARIVSATSWTPYLIVGTQQIVQSAFTPKGEVQRANIDTPAPPKAGKFTDALGGREEAAGTRLTAEFLEYEFLIPGQPTRVERRATFDWLGSGARAGKDASAIEQFRPASPDRLLDLAHTTDILILGAHPSLESAQHLVGTATVRAGRATIRMIRSPEKAQEAFAELDAFEGPSPALISLALARHRWSRFAANLVISRPNVFSYHSGIRADGAGGYEPWSGFDIVSNDVDVAGQPADQDAVSIRLEQGVLDTNAELYLGPSVTVSANAAGMMSGSLAQSNGWMTLVKTNAARMPQRWAADSRADVQKALDRGFAAVVPGENVASDSTPVWWRVDPASGTTLGVGDRGWGQAMKEYNKVLRVFLKSVAAGGCFYRAYSTSSWGRAAVCSLSLAFGILNVAKVGPFEGGLFGTFGDALSIAGLFF